MPEPKHVRVYFHHIHPQSQEWIEQTFQEPLYGVDLETVMSSRDADILVAEDVTFMEPIIHIANGKPVLHLAWHDPRISPDPRVFRLEQRATTESLVHQMHRAIAALPAPRLMAA
jgi:hypothetical protein